MTPFTDLYIEYAKEFTDCPDAFLLWGALLAISSSLSRRVYLETGSWNIAPHIWLILIGKSSSHKSMAISIVEDLIESGEVKRMAPADFSHEAVIHMLAEKPERLFIFDEAKSFLDMLEKSYNEGLKSLFTTLYRKPNYARTTIKHGTLSISNAYLTMGMATTPEWLRQSIKDAESAALSGFLARFLMIPFDGEGNTPIALSPPHNRERFDALKERLGFYRQIEQAFHYTPESLKRLNRWYLAMTERENASLPILGPFFEHLKNEAIHKLAILFAVDRDEREITPAAFECARACLSYVEDKLPGLVEDMTGSKWDREHKRLGKILREHGTIDRTTLSRICHMSGQHLTAHLTGYQQDRIILVKEDSANTKRPRQLVTWVGD